MTDQYSVVLLLHIANWQASADQVAIPPNITIGRFANSPFEVLYHRLCAEQGLDDGEPLEHGAYALIEPVDRYALTRARTNPDTIVEQLANLVAIVSSYALAFSRQIWSADGFRSVRGTAPFHEAGDQVEFLQDRDFCFTDARLDQLRRAWKTVTTLRQAEDRENRLQTALECFYRAWNAPGIAQTCLELATLTDVLFALPHQGETPHETSLTLARFTGRDRAERQLLYPLMRRLYAGRAAILQGGDGQDDGFIDTTVAVFHQLAAILERILTERDLAGRFISISARYELLMQCLLN